MRLLLLLLGLLSAPLMAAPLNIYAASSLTEVVNDLADAWAKAGHERPVPVLGASSALARQVQAGAPANLFLSADEQWMDVLDRAGLLVAGTRADLLTNRLVLVVPAADRRKVVIGNNFAFAALVGRARWVTGDPASVPVGRYARAALSNLGVWAAAEPTLARAENVRSALAFVERGDAVAGIVYATDAKASAKVRVAGVFPAVSHPPIVYPVAVVKGGDSAEARAFLAFLRGPAARRLFVARGFGMAR